MGFDPLPEEEMLRALEGHTFSLGDSDSAVDRIKTASCPECSTPALPVVDADTPLTEDGSQFRYIARCPACSCVFDPDSQTIRTPGNPASSHY